MKKVVTFGEIMLRLSPPGFLRFSQTNSFDIIYGGGESNVAVSLANYGIPVDFVTRLPNNDIGECALQEMRKRNVGTDHIVRGGERLGIYFLETGAVSRGSKVIYDRAHSSISTIKKGDIDWEKVFDGAEWFHWTGITPALSQGAADVCLEAIKAANELGITVSTDLNYRAKLWKYGKEPGEVMPALVEGCDVILGNEEDAEKHFGIHPDNVDITKGESMDSQAYLSVCKKLKERFPRAKKIITTLRGSISASHNSWAGVLYNGDEFLESDTYQITHIVDRVGGGDSFMGGLIYGLLTYKDDDQKALDFAVAASCLKHTVYGDANLVTVDEVEKLMGGDASGPGIPIAMKLEYTWRWYGPDDPITLEDIRQTEATGIVTALHHIPAGEVWSVDEIQKRKKEIEAAGLRWSVVESVPVHEDIKKRSGQYLSYIENYKQTIRNLSLCEIKTLCYNFMPILDWTRTNLNYPVGNGSYALRFDSTAFAAFDLFILRRKGAEEDYKDADIQKAELFFNSMNRKSRDQLTDTIIAGLPGGHEGYSIDEFKAMLRQYKNITAKELESNLQHFLQKVIPVAEEHNILMCIHPDDPPYPILGLPRVVSTQKDIERLLNDVDSPNNGITFCTGSYGVRSDNDMPKMAAEFADRIHFLHLRSVKREKDGSFFEANHLEGDSGIAAVMKAILESPKLKENHTIPVRPDHGHKMLDDIHKTTNPGYSCIGRLKGLSELRGLEQGLRFNMKS